jgi:hypothetical protein
MRYTMELMDPNGTVIDSPKEIELGEHEDTREAMEQTFGIKNAFGSLSHFRVRIKSGWEK